MTDEERLEVHPTWGTRLDGIEGLRGVAALSVMVGHVIILMGGDTFRFTQVLGSISGLLFQGLTLFFALSGFLLYRPFVSSIIHERSLPDTRAFLRNRVLRIWPAYLVILAFVSFVMGSAILEPHGLPTEWKIGYLTDVGTLLANVFLVQGWFPGTTLTGLGVSWSLVPEVCFYLLLPCLGYLGWRLARVVPPIWAGLIPPLLLLLVGLVGRIVWMFATHDGGGKVVSSAGTEVKPGWSDVLLRSILVQGDLFAVGMLAAVIVVVAQRSTASQVRRLRVIGWTTFGLGFVSLFVFGSSPGGFRYTSFGLICASMIALLILPLGGRVVRLAVALLETLPARLAGLCSYSVYLWHLSVIFFLREHVDASRYDTWPGILGSIAWVAVPTLILSAITYRYVEAPAMRRKSRMDRPAEATRGEG